VTLPGPVLNIVDEPSRPIDLTDTGTLHVVATAHYGSTTAPVESRSMTQLIANHGPAQTYSGLHNYARAFFAAGGSRLNVQRYVGPAAANATLALAGTSGTTLNVTAISPGEWGNGASGGLSATVTDSAGARVLVISYGGVEVERTPAFTTQADFVAWGATSKWVRVTAGAGSGVPTAVAITALASGASDIASAGSSQAIAALAKIDDSYGPGQVAIVDRTTDADHVALAAHALAFNRFALLDATPGLAVSSLVSAAAAVTGAGKRVAQLWAQQAAVAGATPGSRVTVPWSAVQAGLYAKNDRTFGPQQPSAGEAGQADMVYALSTEYTIKSDRETLNDAGVNIARTVGGIIRAYSNRTLASPTLEKPWLPASSTRELMRIVALAQPILEHYVHVPIDGEGVTVASVERDLTGMLLDEWRAPRRALYGDAAADAFAVTVTATVSDPADAKITASVWVVTTRGAERVLLNLTHRLEA